MILVPFTDSDANVMRRLVRTAKTNGPSPALARTARFFRAQLVEAISQPFEEAGTDPDWLDSFPVIHRAIPRGHRDIVRLLVEAGADLERPSHDGWAPLTRVDAEEQVARIEYLLSAGADPSSRNRHGFTELHRESRLGDPVRCAELLGAGSGR